MHNSALTVLTWKGQLSYNVYKYSYPAYIQCRKYPNGKCDIHINCQCEGAPSVISERWYKMFSLNILKAVCAVNNLTWIPDNTRVFVYNADGVSIDNEVLGRTGLGIESFSDYFTLTRQYNDAMDWGAWGDDATNLYILRNYYHMDILGADYS